MKNGPTVLSLRGPTKRFGGLVAVNGLDFDVAEHQVMGLIGPNGSGKSTTLNLISGMLKPSSGSITLSGVPIGGLAAADINRRGISRTFQQVRLLGSMTVLENGKAGAVFGHRCRRGNDADVYAMEMIKKVGLGGQAGAHIGQLNHIDTKRVELARVLASDPKLLLLDEWLAGLNPAELEQGIVLIRALRDEGRTVVLVEHVMDAIRSLYDACVVMWWGHKIAERTSAEVLSDAEVVRAYLGDDDA